MSSLRHTSSISSLRSVSSQTQQERRRSQIGIDNDEENNKIEVADHFPASNDIRRRTYDTYNKHVLEDIKSVSSSTSTSTSISNIDNRPFLSAPSPSPSLANFMETSSPSSSSSTTPFPSSKPKVSLLNTLMMRKLYRQSHHHKLDPTLKYWNVLHFISMVWLTLCAFYAEWKRAGDLHHFSSFLKEQNQIMVQFVSIIIIII